MLRSLLLISLLGFAGCVSGPYSKAPSALNQPGHCWTESLKSGQPNAWRCISRDNHIYDPCFTTNTEHIVVCDLNPSNPGNAFLMHLTKPLPESTRAKSTARLPWMIKVADGRICSLNTGVTALADGQRINYLCDAGAPVITVVPEGTSYLAVSERGAPMTIQQLWW